MKKLNITRTEQDLGDVMTINGQRAQGIVRINTNTDTGETMHVHVELQGVGGRTEDGE